MTGYILGAAAVLLVTARITWQAATRHHAHRLRQHADFYGANLIDPPTRSSR